MQCRAQTQRDRKKNWVYIRFCTNDRDCDTLNAQKTRTHCNALPEHETGTIGQAPSPRQCGRLARLTENKTTQNDKRILFYCTK